MSSTSTPAPPKRSNSKRKAKETVARPKKKPRKKRRQPHRSFKPKLEEDTNEEELEPNKVPFTRQREPRTKANTVPQKKKGKKKKQDLKRNNQRKCGLFQRVTDEDGEVTREIDYKAIEEESDPQKWECREGGNCKLDCCNRLRELDGDVLKEHIRAIQDGYREAVAKAGREAGNAVLRDHIRPVYPKAKKVLARLKRRVLKGGFVFRSGCQWCSAFGEVSESCDHYFTKRQCPCWEEAQIRIAGEPAVRFIYTIPSIDEQRPYEVSRYAFMVIYGIKSDKLTSLTKTLRMIKPSDAYSKIGQHGKQKKLSEQDINWLLDIVTRNLSESGDHYVKFDNNSKTQSFDSNVTRASLWWEFCETHDKEFAEQAKRLGYKHGVDGKIMRPTPELFAQDIAGKQIFPRVSYERARCFFDDYDVRFGHLRVDVCETCENLKFNIATKPKGQKPKYLKLQCKHLRVVDVCYKFRQADHLINSKYVLVFDADFAGSLRTPWVHIAKAYFSKIYQMYNYVIAGPNFVDMYGYDERVASKSPDETCSFILDFILAAKARQPEIHHVIIWCDGCAGQTWNQYTFRLIHEIVNPDSIFHIPGIRRIDLKKAVKGHSYLWCDRAIGPIKDKARRCPRGIVSMYDEEVLPEKWKGQTWQSCIEASTMNGKKYRFHRVEQSMVKAFKEYWGREESVLIKGKSYNRAEELKGPGTSAQPLRYVDKEGKIGEVFSSRKICWVTAGSIDKKEAGKEGDGTVIHNGALYCRENFNNESEWLQLLMFRGDKPGVPGVTPENYKAEQAKQGELNVLYTEPRPVDPEKMDQTNYVIRAVDPDLLVLYPLSAASLATAIAKEKALQDKKKQLALNRAARNEQSLSSSSNASSSSSSSSSSSPSFASSSSSQ